MCGPIKSSSHVAVIPHFIIVFDILSVLPLIIFEGALSEGALHCAIEFHLVLVCPEESVIIVVVIGRLLLELAHSLDELLHTVRAMDDAIWVVEVGK